MVYLSLIVAAALVGIDQLTKWLAVTYLKPVGYIPLIKFGETEVLNLTYAENKGAAFSILQDKQLFLIIITSIILVFILIFMLTKRIKNTGMIWCCAIIIAGGAGNLIDRIFSGFVVDFIDFSIINFAIFNFADICAVLGCIGLVIFMISDEVKISKKKKMIAGAAPEQEDIDDE